MLAKSFRCILLSAVFLGFAAECLADGQPAPIEAAKPEKKIDIKTFRVQGNTVLPQVEVEDAVLPYLGLERPISDVEKARAALEKAYRARGFEAVGVEIPAQDVRGGVVILSVVELKIGRLRVTDSRYFSPQDIKARVPSLKEGLVPNYQSVAKDLAAVNKSADRSITPTLRAGKQINTVDVDLKVEDHAPVHGSLELNDRNSSSTERLRLSGAVSYTNLFQLEHSLNLQGQFTPQSPHQSWVASASYVMPVQDTPYTFVVYGVHSDSDVAAIGGIGVLGKGDIIGLRSIYSLVSGDPGAAFVHQFSAGLDYKSFQESLVLGSDSSSTPINYVPLTLDYSLSHRTASYDFDFGLGFAAGLRGFGSSSSRYALKRYMADANWYAFDLNLSYLRRFADDWRAGAKLAAQYGGQALISNEQFSAGGLESVRGYFESQQLGDDGASLQLQIDTPSFHQSLGGWFNELRLFGFADGAALRTYFPLSSQNSHTELASAGLGISVRMFDYVNASTIFAAPLVDKSSVRTDIGDAVRVQFRLWTEL